MLPKNFVVISGDIPADPAYLTGTDVLNHVLRVMGYTPTLVAGKYNGQIEHSLLVPDLPIEVALEVARWFGQESILSVVNNSAHLLYTNSQHIYRTVPSPVKVQNTEPAGDYTRFDNIFFTVEF